MKFTRKRLGSYFIILLHTQNCFADANCPSTPSALVFVNGMFNSKDDARASLNLLQKINLNKFDRYELAYNLNVKPLQQLLQVYRQKMKSEERLLWSYFSKINGPEWFNRMMSKQVEKTNASSYVSDKDLQSHISIYNSLLAKQYTLVLVAHSQGNFYANQSFEYLKKMNSDSEGRINIVGVASPDSYVSGD